MQEVQRFTAVLEQKELLTPDLGIFRFRPSIPFIFLPGQFVTLGLINKGTKKKRAFSIASAPSKPCIELLVKRVPGGAVSPLLFSLREGEEVEMIGPAGSFTLEESAGRVVLLAGGTGLAPLMSMARFLAEKGFPNETLLIHGASYRDELAYMEELRGYEETHSKFRYVPTLSRRDDSWRGEMGRVEDILSKHLKEPEGVCYVCGPPGMVENTVKTLNSLGFPDSKIRTEAW